MSDMKPLNITPKRLEALRFLVNHPRGVCVAHLADEILTSKYRLSINSGFSRQQATRSGSGCATPLIKAGLVSVRYQTQGWGDVAITNAGRELLAELDEPVKQTLDMVLEQCIATETPNPL